MRMNVKEYLKWVELYKPFFKLIKEYVGRAIEPKCQLATIKGCGHVVSIESPKLFNELASDFLVGKSVPESVQAEPVPYKWSELRALKG